MATVNPVSAIPTTMPAPAPSPNGDASATMASIAAETRAFAIEQAEVNKQMGITSGINSITEAFGSVAKKSGESFKQMV